jgi:hypothetical protein
VARCGNKAEQREPSHTGPPKPPRFAPKWQPSGAKSSVVRNITPKTQKLALHQVFEALSSANFDTMRRLFAEGV